MRPKLLTALCSRQLKSQIRLFEMRVRAHEDDEMKLKEQVAFLEKTVVRLKDECLQIENLKWRAEEERNSLACEARRNRMMMDHDDMSKNSASTTVQSKKQSPQKDDWLKGAASALSSPGSAQAVQEYAAALRMSKDDESKLRSSEASCASGVASVPSPRHARVILCAPFAHKESAEASPGERGGADMHMSLSHESVVPAFGIATARVSLQHASLALDGSASSTECERKGSVSTPSHPQAQVITRIRSLAPLLPTLQPPLSPTLQPPLPSIFPLPSIRHLLLPASYSSFYRLNAPPQYPDMNWVVTVSDPVVSLVVSEDHQHAPPSIHCISMHPGSEPGAEAGSEPGAEVGSHCSSDAVHWTECSCSHVCADGCDVVTADFSTTPRGEQRAYFETVLPPTMGIPTRDGVVGAHRVHAASSDYHGGHHHHHHEDHHQKECSLFPVGRMRLSATSHQHMHHNQATASELQNEAARVATELNDAVAHSRHSAGAAAPLLLLLPPSDGVFTGTNWTDAHRLASGAGAGVAFGGASKHVQERQAFEWGSLVNRAGGAAGLAKPPLGGSVSRPPIAASAAAAAARAPQHAVHALPSGTGGASRPLIPKLSLATLGGEGEAVPLGGVGASSFRSQVSASSFRPQVSASSIGGNFVSPRFHQLSRTPDEECLREGAHNLAHNAGFVSARLPNAAEVDYDKASFEGRSSELFTLGPWEAPTIVASPPPLCTLSLQLALVA